MNDARDEILARVRTSLKSAYLPGARASLPAHIQAPAGDPAALVEAFSREATALGVHLHRCETPAQATETILKVLGEIGGTEILAWADDALPLGELGAAVRSEELALNAAKGWRVLDPNVPGDGPARREKLAELGRASAGLTGALAGLADTGTLVLHGGAGRPRLASLLPPVHIAMLRASHIYPTMAAFLAAHAEAVHAGSNLVFITGASRTSDIELTLTLGVHGPKILHIAVLLF